MTNDILEFVCTAAAKTRPDSSRSQYGASAQAPGPKKHTPTDASSAKSRASVQALGSKTKAATMVHKPLPQAIAVDWDRFLQVGTLTWSPTDLFGHMNLYDQWHRVTDVAFMMLKWERDMKRMLTLADIPQSMVRRESTPHHSQTANS
jgi:hypothetical protein